MNKSIFLTADRNNIATLISMHLFSTCFRRIKERLEKNISFQIRYRRLSFAFFLRMDRRTLNNVTLIVDNDQPNVETNQNFLQQLKNKPMHPTPL